MLNSMLISELRAISKHHWAGMVYSSFHHPKFTIKGFRSCQRDTLERFEKMGITEEAVKDKVVLDIGSCTGGMLARAMQLGAKKVIGIDVHSPNIEFCKKLFPYLDYNNAEFHWKNVDDINNLNEFPKCDVIFCFALSKWCNAEHLVELLSKSGVKLIFYEDNKYMGKIIKDIIPKYNCEFVWRSEAEGNSPPNHPGWGRMSYVCKKKEKVMNIGIE